MAGLLCHIVKDLPLIFFFLFLQAFRTSECYGWRFPQAHVMRLLRVDPPQPFIQPKLTNRVRMTQCYRLQGCTAPNAFINKVVLRHGVIYDPQNAIGDERSWHELDFRRRSGARLQV